MAAYGTAEPPEYEREEDRPDDTLVAWKEADHMAVIGILHVILALILANGRSIPDRMSCGTSVGRARTAELIASPF